jgi:nitroreductase
VEEKNHAISALQWRYATKKFDRTKKLSEEQLDVLLEALRLSPSSFGLEPWCFIVITNPEIRANNYVRLVLTNRPK